MRAFLWKAALSKITTQAGGNLGRRSCRIQEVKMSVLMLDSNKDTVSKTPVKRAPMTFVLPFSPQLCFP